MPGFDGTGPLGMGPMTGGGRGNCIGYWPNPYYQYGHACNPWMDRGRGRGRRHQYCLTGLPGWMRDGRQGSTKFYAGFASPGRSSQNSNENPGTKEYKLSILRSREAFLEERLQDIRESIKTLTDNEKSE